MLVLLACALESGLGSKSEFAPPFDPGVPVAGPVTSPVDDAGVGRVAERDEADNVAAWDAGCPPCSRA